MLETDSRVVPLHDVAEVINERLDRRVVLVIDVLGTATGRAEGALLETGITAPLLLGFGGRHKMQEVPRLSKPWTSLEK